MVSVSPGNNADLTSRARIRNAALRLFASQGVAATPLRTVAAEAGVTVGLIPHHFGSKEGLYHEVEEWVVRQFAEAIDAVNLSAGPKGADPQARDEAVATMLTSQPMIVDFLRRELFYPTAGATVLEKLADLATAGVSQLREAGWISQRRSRSDQAIDMLVRYLGRLFMQPLVDRMYHHMAAGAGPVAAGAGPAGSPHVIVGLEKR